MAMGTDFSPLERALLNDHQHDFPLCPRPFAELARRHGVDEDTVIRVLQGLQGSGAVSRVGAVVRPNRIGASTLAAMAVPQADLERVARLVNGFDEVNHNYERRHEYNLWFVVAAPSRQGLSRVLADIEGATGLPVLDLPMLEDYFMNLGFSIQWE